MSRKNIIMRDDHRPFILAELAADAFDLAIYDLQGCGAPDDATADEIDEIEGRVQGVVKAWKK